MSGRLSIVVAGMVAGTPHHGGATWAVLQYVLGFRHLGHDVWLVEPVDRIEAPSAHYFSSVVARFGLGRRAALVDVRARESVGARFATVAAAARDADLLMNLSGLLREPDLVPDGSRVYVDLDPGFTQAWALAGVDVGLDGHTHFATVGTAVGTPTCPIPTLGRHWIALVPPVVLDEWAPAPPPARPVFTTVGNWRSYGSIECDGLVLGQRAHSVRRLLGLPRLAPAPVASAFAIDPGEASDLRALRNSGWGLLDAAAVASTPDAYQRFVRESYAELGIAKSGYVDSRCAWFSDRSACYLAAGKPVVAQDTGWSASLPTGEGLFAFEDAEGAAEAMAAVIRDHARHAAAARALASDVFDSDRVLGGLLNSVGA